MTGSRADKVVSGAPLRTISSLSPAAERQPGGRAPAPGPLAVLQAFVNTHEDLDRQLQERLVTAEVLAHWLIAHGLLAPGSTLGPRELHRGLHVREGLRAMLFANNDCAYEQAAIERLNRFLRGPGVFVQLAPGTAPDFASVETGLGGPLALLAQIVAVAQLDGTWPRLKACPGTHCGWAFYDHSRNQNGSWCSMSVCGSRAKAREYRRRRASTS